MCTGFDFRDQVASLRSNSDLRPLIFALSITSRIECGHERHDASLSAPRAVEAPGVPTRDETTKSTTIRRMDGVRESCLFEVLGAYELVSEPLRNNHRGNHPSLREAEMTAPFRSRARKQHPLSRALWAGALIMVCFEHKHEHDMYGTEVMVAIPDSSGSTLGGPKSAFPSSALRSPNRSLDSPGLSAFGSFSGDAAKGDYFGRGKVNGDREIKDDSCKEGHSAASRGGRFNGDPWSGIRSARTFGDRDGRTSRRSGDHLNADDRNECKEGRGHGLKAADGFEPRSADGTRRNGVGTKPAWYTDAESSERHSRGENNRSRDWRDLNRVPRRSGDRDWTRDNKAEQDPEWMMDSKPEGKEEKHTAQDIEQWKASMKAQQAEGRGREDLQSFGDQAMTAAPDSKSKPAAPLTLDHGVDSFFNVWGQAMPNNSLRPSEATSKPQSALAPKSSRFTDFFSPQPPFTPSNTEAPAPYMPQQPQAAPEDFQDTSNDDKLGFQRMIQQLRSQQPLNLANPPVGNPTAIRPRQNTPPLEQSATNVSHSPPIISPRSRKSHQLENILGLQSPLEAPASLNRDSEFLLNLMRQEPGLKQVLPPEYRQPPTDGALSNLPPPSSMHHPHPIHGTDEDSGMRQPFFDEPPSEQIQHFDALNPNAHPQNHHHHQMSPFERREDGGGRNFHPPHPQLGMLPPPPGLSGRSMQPGPFSPFISNPPGQPPSHSRMIGPPPGFSNQPPSAKQQQFPPGLPPIANLSLGGDRAPFGMPGMGGPLPGADGSGPGTGPHFTGGPPPPMGNGMPPPFPPHAGFLPMGGSGPGHFGQPSGRPPGPMGPPGGMDVFGYGNGPGRLGNNGGPEPMGRRLE